MKNKTDIIRYGSAQFTYITSLFVITNIFGRLCDNVISILFFIIFTVIIYLSRYKNPFQKIGIGNGFFELIIIISLVFTSIFEKIAVHGVFVFASDTVSSSLGRYVLGLSITAISFICALFGGYTAIKLSNLIFLFPVSVVIILLFSFFTSSIDLSYSVEIKDFNFLYEMICGISASALMFSDSYIIDYIQKKENCYKNKYSSRCFVISALIVLVVSILLRGLFGGTILQILNFPIISAVGIIPFFDFEEIIMLAVSVCIIYREICRICVYHDIIKGRIKGGGRSGSVSLTLMLSVLCSIAGTMLFEYDSAIFYLAMITFLISVFSFVLVPLIFMK